MNVAQAQADAVHLETLEPEALLAWALSTHGDRAGLVTSFQLAGCVTIDMASRVAPALRVLTIDTLRLHQETYALIEQIETRYGLEVERFTPDPARLRRMIEQHGEYLFFDTKAKQEHCCHVRKVEPQQCMLDTLDVWISGLRRDQSEARKTTRKASVIHHGGRPVIKLNPLADWSQERVEAYVQEHQVPCNTLYDAGYSSIGCVICSTPTLPWEGKRAGRWRWFNQFGEGQAKECGIHTHGGGI